MWTRKPSLFMLLKKKREEIWEKMAKLLLEKELEEVIESIHDIKSGSYSIKNGNLILSNQRPFFY